MHGQLRALTHKVLRQATIERSLRGGNFGFEGKKMYSNVFMSGVCLEISQPKAGVHHGNTSKFFRVNPLSSNFSY